MDSLNWSAHEDRDLLNGASKSFVRQQLRDWSANCSTDEKSRPDAAPFIIDQTPRTTYCVQVDEAALKSVVEPDPKLSGPFDNLGFVNLVRADWEVPDPADHDPEETGFNDPFDEGEDPVEGCRLWDVGWWKVSACGSMLGTYGRLLSKHWGISYVRPPGVAVH